ncbi:MAG: transposase [Bryobacteraceae bacterium]
MITLNSLSRLFGAEHEQILYELERARCPRCGMLPKSLYGNQLITQVVILHYRQGIPMGRLCEQLGVGLGAVFDILHRMAALFKDVIPMLSREYRQSPMRHADETGWRMDGRSGYAWLFATPELSRFLFRSARSARVPREVLHKLAKRMPDPTAHFKSVLDRLAHDPKRDPIAMLFPNNSS